LASNCPDEVCVLKHVGLLHRRAVKACPDLRRFWSEKHFSLAEDRDIKSVFLCDTQKNLDNQDLFRSKKPKRVMKKSSSFPLDAQLPHLAR